MFFFNALEEALQSDPGPLKSPPQRALMKTVSKSSLFLDPPGLFLTKLAMGAPYENICTYY